MVIRLQRSRDSLMTEMISHPHRDFLTFLDRVYPSSGDAFWLPGRELWVADVAAARAVLSNSDGLYKEHSDFFGTRRGTFGPRSAQVRIASAGRALLSANLAARAHLLADAVRKRLVPTSEWPDAGNRLVYEHLSPMLISQDDPPALRQTVDEIVERSVLAGARERQSVLRGAAFRFRTMLELTRAVECRRQRRPRSSEPMDLLDVVVSGAEGTDAAAADLAEVFLSFVFGASGSIAFALGWSLYLLGANPDVRAEPAFIAREALRLYPVAWVLGRRPTRRHEVLGIVVTPRDHVIVCPYLVHRNPRHWAEPTRFRPERWASPEEGRGFIPFGWGPHSCVAGGLSLQLVEDILRILLGEYHLSTVERDHRPHVGPALAPPRFTLRLSKIDGRR